MKAIFVHHPYHFKTKSFSFFAEILESLGYDLTFIDRNNFDINQLDDANLLVLWQAEEVLGALVDCEIKIVCVPMLDEALPRNVEFFTKFKDIKFISFSRYLQHFLNFSGLESFYLQYWIDSKNIDQNIKKDQVFFWERNPSHLDFETAYKFALKNNLRLIYKIGADPHDESNIVVNLKNKNDIYVIDGWISDEELREIFASSKYFISSRPWEGIGITMLEAISYGCICLAFNNPTMNEYLNRSNGYLFRSAKGLERKRVKNFETKFRNLMHENSVGASEYKSKITHLHEFLSKANKSNRVRLLPYKLTLRNYIRFFRFIY